MDGDNPASLKTADAAEKFQYLFENVQDAVVEFEFEGGEPVVRGVNRSFCDLFGVDRARVVGTPLNDLIVPNEHAGQSSRFDQRTAAGKPNYAIVDRRTENGLTTLLYRGIPYEGGDRGFALYTDLTDEIRQERELAVLNRVLRYNLSTEVESLRAHAERLADGVSDPDLAASAEHVLEGASALDRLREEARDVERVLDADPDLEPTSVREAVESALDAVALVEYANVETDVGDVPAVLSGGHLDRALAALVDNAVRHTDATTPTVRITAERRGDVVAVTVGDDGPGLPEQERGILTGDVELTPLDHGSGLGLWLVRWVATAYDGSVAYSEGDDGGSDVTLELRAAVEP